MKVIHGTASERRPSPLEDAYMHFRLDRQGLPASPRTLGFYDEKVGAFLAWLRHEHPQVRRFEELDIAVVRQYRARIAAGSGLRGLRIQPETLAGSDRALRAFFHWAQAEGYAVAPRKSATRRSASDPALREAPPSQFEAAAERLALLRINPMPDGQVGERVERSG